MQYNTFLNLLNYQTGPYIAQAESKPTVLKGIVGSLTLPHFAVNRINVLQVNLMSLPYLVDVSLQKNVSMVMQIWQKLLENFETFICTHFQRIAH